MNEVSRGMEQTEHEGTSRRTLRGRVLEVLESRTPDGEKVEVLLQAPTEDLRLLTRAPFSAKRGDWIEVEGSFEGAGRRFLVESLQVIGSPAPRPGESFEWELPIWTRRRRRLIERSRLLKAIRAFATAEGLVEVETPTLLFAPGQEPHLQPFRTIWHGPQGAREMFLATSPEYAMKRLIAAGMERIFQLGRAYRDGADELSPLHSPEFTLLEWYAVGCGLGDIAAQCGRLLETSARDLCGGPVVERDGRFADLSGAPRWLSVASAFEEFAAIDLSSYLQNDDEAFLAAVAPRRLREPGDRRQQADSEFFRTLIERIEPRLGHGAPTVLHSYPARHAALAQLDGDDPRVARRFELYVLGVELANAFEELRDPAEQERRLLEEQRSRGADGPRYPISQEFLAALRSGTPPFSGIALGVDRLHLLISGAEDLSELLPFPFPAH